MKKIGIFLLVATMVLCFAGCRSNLEEPTPTPTPTPVTTPAPSPTPTPIPDTTPIATDEIPNVPDPSVDDGTLQDIIPDNMTVPSARSQTMH